MGSSKCQKIRSRHVEKGKISSGRNIEIIKSIVTYGEESTTKDSDISNEDEDDDLGVAIL